MLNLGIMSKFPKQFQRAASLRNGEEEIFGFILSVLRLKKKITLVIKATTENIPFVSESYSS